MIHESDKNLVAITTFHNSLNFGAVLQTYALQRTLYLLGYESQIIDFRKEHFIEDTTFKKKIHRIIFSLINFERRNNFKKFVKKYLVLTEYIHSFEELKKISSKYLFAITGSDQVWNWNLTQNSLDYFLLQFFPESVRKISYGPSVGDINIFKQHLRQYQNALKKFYAISCRENDAVDLLKKISGKNVVTVLDPTLIVPVDEWKDIYITDNIKEKYLLFYTFGVPDELRKATDKFAKDNNLTVVHFHNRKKFSCKELKCPNASPQQFITLIKNAEYVVTNSFHGTAFSIIHHKNFVIELPKKRSYRLKYLSQQLGFQSRCIEKNYNLSLLFSSILNYEQIESNLAQLRRESLQYLKDALKY